ncbi:MAG: sulfotransferase family protein [Bacteroidetes bacterium]|nr:sulfotransferase family protein [Bacteroidota bacterium]
MLVSHRKKFIFTKTAKTAGTSVESYFEQYCIPDWEWQESHWHDEYISETGIIGSRGPRHKGSTWYGHMPAKRIRDLIGQDVWDDYYKFTVIRNPYDKLISGYFFKEKRKKNYTYKKRTVKIVKKLLGIGDPISRVTGNTEIERFRCWLREGGDVIDRDKYLIDEKECMDYFIRFENLHEGIRHVCDRLSISYEPTRIPQFKKGIRHNRLEVKDYYDDETIRIVQSKYAWELKRFGYEL